MPEDMTAVISAEVALGRIQAELAEVGQWLPVDGCPDQPIGRLVEENSSSPLRLGYGAWRDLLLGVQFTNGRGQLISVGGITMKNVAGYDLTKLMVGQRGILGRLVTLATRTYRRPAGAIQVALPVDSTLLSQMLASPLRPQWSLLTPEELLLGYLGDEASLGYYERELSVGQLGVPRRVDLDCDMALRRRVWSRDAATPNPSADCVRVSLPPRRLREFLLASGSRDFVADPAFGVAMVFDVSPQNLAPTLPRFGARASVYRDSTMVNYGFSVAEQALLRRLKAAFDPDGRLASLEFA